MFYKEYTIPVHRKIATTVANKTTVEDSHFFMETGNKKDDIYINTYFESTIYNIERKNNSLIIYSNTLNLKVTDKFYNNTPLYYFYNDSSELTLQLDSIEEKLQDFDNTDIYFLNKTEELAKLANIKLIYDIGNPLTRSENVKVRKLKDRFKITIQNINGLDAKIELNSKYIFEPILHNNYIEFSESIVKVGSSLYYLYNHSFNKQSKIEVIFDEDLTFKDPVLNFNAINYDKKTLVYYDTFKSNLLFNNKLDSDFYYYLRLNPSDKTDLIYQSIEEKFSNDLMLIFSIKKRDVVRDIGINPHLKTELKTPLGENYTIVYTESYLDKYIRPEDIKIGTEVLLTDAINSAKSEVPYLYLGSKQYYQDLNVNSWSHSEYNEHNTEDLESIFYDNYRELVNNLKNWYNDGVEYT